MKAWQIHRHGEPHEALQLVDVKEPEAGPGWMQLRVLTAGVGLPDVFMCRGGYAFKPELPFTPGQEVVGEVVAVGEGVRPRVGQRVMAVAGFHVRAGSFAQTCIALDGFAPTVPERMSDAEAAGFVIPYWTAYYSLVRRANLLAGETLLVLGASGGTGSAAIQLGKALGARVVAVAGGGEKARACEELGADVVIDHGAVEVAEAVREATGGNGADVVYDPVGGEAFTAATRCVATEGRILLVGFASGSWGQPSPPHMVNRNYSVLGTMPGGATPEFTQHAERELTRLWEAGQIRVPVHRIFDFEQTPAAVDELARRTAMGKVVVRVGSQQ